MNRRLRHTPAKRQVNPQGIAMKTTRNNHFLAFLLVVASALLAHRRCWRIGVVARSLLRLTTRRREQRHDVLSRSKGRMSDLPRSLN